ncbi:hypothetical protein F2Q69_00037580 [Brassica cretica]|uniref:Uncharacterized protein n=1 Tax=Brassica cretica TaxID=69181 RepID=A0A8S9STR4_BRACR|nr:hypothetical protein F2Q69_00037580 [Brassica cretica]
MKKGFLGSSKKKSADSRTIRKSTREESIDTLQAASIDNIHHQSIATRQTTMIDRANQPSENTLLDDFIAKRDEQHVSGELSRVEEAGTEDTTSTSTDITTSTSIDITTSTSINITTSTLIDNMTQCRPTTRPQHRSIEDETTPENLDHNLEKKLDDHQHTPEKDLETSLEARIGRHQPDEIDRQPPRIDRHRQPLIDRHHPPNIDRFPLLDEPHGFIVEMELIEERVHESETSHNDDYKHLRPLTCAEEAAGLHKRVKRIHDPVKIVVSCAVFETESPIHQIEVCSSFLTSRHVWGKEEEELEEEKKDHG